MKYQANIQRPYGIKSQNKSTKFVLIAVMSLVLFITVPLDYSSLTHYSFILKSFYSDHESSPRPSERSDEYDGAILTSLTHKCDIFSGEWVPNPDAPYYTNRTCWAIHEHQNCMKYGRPDTEFMKWRWKPDGCELPVFDPVQFFELLRDKSLAFVGDSVARNQMQSLICLLSRLEYPIDVSNTSDETSTRLKYTTYNFTLHGRLLDTLSCEGTGVTHIPFFSLYLDEYDKNWTSQVSDFDYILISAGHWFNRPLVFYENRRVVGCLYCVLPNATDLGMGYGYRKAFRTAFKAINSLKNYKGITYLRTFSPSHFENGPWDKGGNCIRTRPFRSNETVLEGQSMELHRAQIEEFRAAEMEGKKRGLKFRLLDTTQAMLLRPDGHPSRYGHWANENVTLYNDCVHWCLPGPIDTWNDFLLEMLKTESLRSAEERLHSKDRKLLVS